MRNASIISAELARQAYIIHKSKQLRMKISSESGKLNEAIKRASKNGKNCLSFEIKDPIVRQVILEELEMIGYVVMNRLRSETNIKVSWSLKDLQEKRRILSILSNEIPF